MSRSDNRDDPFVNLRDVDLSGVDLSHIELDDDLDEPSRWARPVAALSLLLLAVLMVWLPTTELYHRELNGGSTPFLFGAGGVILGLTAGRMLWRWAEEAAERYAAQRVVRPKAPPKPPSALARWSLLLLIVGIIAGVLFGIPRASYEAGGRFDDMWYLASIGAIIAGVLIGRWLMMQAQARPPTERRVPIVLPPWVKWLTLTALLLLAGFAFFGMNLFGGNGSDEDAQTGLGAIGFAVGLMGAIWLARRFDELEAKATRKRA